jgi:uncharacterized protein YdeI (YjbR/CyaY-like superfamily)
MLEQVQIPTRPQCGRTEIITDIDDYFSTGCGRCEPFATPDRATRHWSSGLKDLRRIANESGLVERVKRGRSCYMNAGRNIAILGAYRNDFRLGFVDAAPMRDAGRVLERREPNTRHPVMRRFADNAQVAQKEPLILS